MIGEPSRHRGCALFPCAALRGWAWQSDAHRTLGTPKGVEGILQGDRTLHEVFLLGRRERLAYQPVGVEHAFGFLAWTPRSAFERGRLWRTGVGDQGGHLGGQFVTREPGRASRRARLQLGQKRDGVRLTPFLADRAHHAQPTG